MALPESAKEETERQENEENGGNEENEETFQGESPGEEDSTERIVVLPEEEEEDFDDVLRNGPPSAEFTEFFNSIPTEENNEHTLEYLCNFAWSQYTDAGRQVDMEGEAKAWMTCSIFLSMLKKKLSPVSSHVFSIRSLQCSSGVSIIELFDKLERYTETVSNSKKIKEQIQKVQGSLAVAAVVYKKLLPIYRGVFLEMETPSTTTVISSYDLLKIIWTAFSLLKKHLKQEDLLNSYNLLLCVIELVYEWICKLHLDELVNHEFSEKFLSSDCSILEFLCRTFGGSVLDAKHFKQHIFNEKVVSVLHFEGAEFDPAASLKRWEESYENLLLRRAELDERMFLPAERDFNQVFDALYDGSAVELLRRGPDDTNFADVELLLRMSTQNCLEKLMDNKKNGPNASKSYILSSDNLFPTTPLTANSQNPTKLMTLVPEGFNVAGSQLEMICSEMKESPLPIIASHIEYFAQLFTEKVTAEAEELGEEYDADIFDNLEMLTDFVKDLSYTIIERIVKAEREKRADSEGDLCNVYQKEEFLQSIAVCVLELVFFSYNSKREFPWSIDLLNLEPICFQKAVQLVVRALPELSREMVKHLNKKEEEVLEELGWTEQSPIWLAVSKNPGCIPSCDVAWKQPKMLAEKYSPVKRMRLEDGSETPAKPIASSITLIQFVGKVYFLACGRLNDLCDRVKITEIGKRMCWTLLDHVLRNETSLMLNRHLDQNLLCVVYAVAKYLMVPCTFMDLIAHYRHQPQCNSYIYREINVDSSVGGTSPSDDGNSRDSTSNPVKLRCGSTIPTSADSVTGSPGPSNCEKVDLITYYNKVFLPRVESFVKTLEAAQDKLIPMPKTSNFGSLPMKRTIGERFQVNVTSLSSTTNQIERRYKYNLNQSPRKELQAINQMVNVGHSTYYEHESPDQKVYTTAFRR